MREGEEWVVEGVNHNVFVFYFVGPASIKFVFSLIECYRLHSLKNSGSK